MNTPRIHHVMLPVADLDRAIDFYTRVMGMTQFSRKSFPADQTENAMVGYGTPPGPPMIELIKDLASKEVPKLANHVAIQVNDLKALLNDEQKAAFDKILAAMPQGRRGGGGR